MNFRPISDGNDFTDLSIVPADNNEEELLPKYSGGYGVNEYGKCRNWNTLGNEYKTFFFSFNSRN